MEIEKSLEDEIRDDTNETNEKITSEEENTDYTSPTTEREDILRDELNKKE